MKPGKAADWDKPHLERLVSHHQDALTTLLEFTKAFDEAFGDLDTSQLAAQQIEALKQDGSVTDSTTAFKSLRSELEWNELALISRYEQGLQHHIKTQLALMNP